MSVGHKHTVELPQFLETAGGCIPLRITGTYFRGQPAYTPRGEYAPIDPPEPANFELDVIEMWTGNHWVQFPMPTLPQKVYEALIEVCIEEVEYT